MKKFAIFTMKMAFYATEPFLLPLLIVAAFVAKFFPKKYEIGLGPLPLINNIYHKKVFQKIGYTTETFVNQIWHITNDFDLRSDRSLLEKIPKIGKKLNIVPFAIRILFRYRCVVLYFNGGVLGVANTLFLWRFEPLLFSLANVKTIILAYGGDVQDMSRSPNLIFKDKMSKDYPQHRLARKKIEAQIDLWTTHGNHVIGGCEWVDYMHHWDTLMISHFSIDEGNWIDDEVTEVEKEFESKAMRVLHAPNHRSIKGTSYIIKAVDDLRSEGYNIELILAEKLSNEQIKKLIKSCDVVVDQLIVGWYAMFAIEAMALQKPVVCYYRQDLENLYRTCGLYELNEKIPLINSSPLEIKNTLARLYSDRKMLIDAGKAGREYVLKHHSIDSVMNVFSPIVKNLIGSPALMPKHKDAP